MRTILSLNEQRLLAMYDQNPENLSLNVYSAGTYETTPGAYIRIYPELLQLIVRELVARNADLRARYFKESGVWQREERDLLPEGAYVVIHRGTEATLDKKRNAFRKRNFKPDEAGSLFQIAVFDYPKAKMAVDFVGSHLVIDAASARVLYTMIERLYGASLKFFHHSFPWISRTFVRVALAYQYWGHDDKAMMQTRQLQEIACNDSENPANLYWKGLYQDRSISYLPTVVKEVRGSKTKAYVHQETYNKDPVQQFLLEQVDSQSKVFSGIHFWLAAVSVALLKAAGTDEINTPVRIPVARIGLDIGYNSVATVLLLSAAKTDTFVALCERMRKALSQSQQAQAFPILNAMGQYAPKVGINYVKADSTLDLIGARFTPDISMLSVENGSAVDAWYEEKTYPIEVDLGVYPARSLLTCQLSTASHDQHSGVQLLSNLNQLSMWASYHPAEPVSNWLENSCEERSDAAIL